jgi:hypothetical protein
MSRPPTLRLFQAMAICIDQRDETGLREGLRILTDMVDDDEGERILRLLVKSLTPEDKFWFGNLDGARKPKPLNIDGKTN